MVGMKPETIRYYLGRLGSEQSEYLIPLRNINKLVLNALSQQSEKMNAPRSNLPQYSRLVLYHITAPSPARCGFIRTHGLQTDSYDDWTEG